MDARRDLSSDTISVAYSILPATAVGDAVARVYRLDGPARCVLIRRGSLRDSYELSTAGGRQVVRVYRSGVRSLEELTFEFTFLSHLAVGGMDVSLPLQAADGERISCISAPEGIRYVSVLPFSCGEALAPANEAHCRLAGRLLAAIHGASDGFSKPAGIASFDLERLIDQPLAAVRPFFQDRPGDLQTLESLCHDLRERLTAIAPALSRGVCHGDLLAKRIHWHQDGHISLVSCTNCAPGWLAYDLSADSWRVANGTDSWTPFINGYLELKPLSAADLEAVDMFRGVRLLGSLGIYARNVNRWGLEKLTAGKLTGWLTSLRDWSQKHAFAR